MIGLGRVGLPTAATIAAAGHRVVGVDKDASRLESIRRGSADHEEPGLTELVGRLLEGGELTLEERPERAEVYIIATPSARAPGDAPPGLGALLGELGPLLAPGALIAIETTCAPGTTSRELVAPLQESGFAVGEEVFVAHCPERVIPGDALRELTHNARVIGAHTARGRDEAAKFYATFTRGEVTTTSLRVAEMTKLIENTYRDVNIALANELADLGEQLELDVIESIALANTHPRVHIHRPGVGVGGACLPLATSILSELAQDAEGILATTRRINDAIPARLARVIASRCEGRAGGHVALLGAAYKGDVASTAQSPSGALWRALAREGLEVRAHDPVLSRWDVSPLVPLDVALDGARAVVFAVPHLEYGALRPGRLSAARDRPLIFDLCGALDAPSWARAGLTLWRRGVGDAVHLFAPPPDHA